MRILYKNGKRTLNRLVVTFCLLLTVSSDKIAVIMCVYWAIAALHVRVLDARWPAALPSARYKCDHKRYKPVL